jgi:hypothetical protein
MKRTKKYLVTYDGNGGIAIWELHADLTVTPSALLEVDLKDTTTPVIDLR